MYFEDYENAKGQERNSDDVYSKPVRAGKRTYFFDVKATKGRKDFYDFFTFGDNWGVASNYDLCIDSSKLGTEKTAEFIIEFGRSSGLIG